MRMSPSIFLHVMKVIRLASLGFNKHVPREDRQVDAMAMFASYRNLQFLRKRLPGLEAQDNGPMSRAFDVLPLGEQLTALRGVIRSQLPKHNPATENLPALADVWFERFEAGYDVTRWYTAESNSTGRSNNG